MDYIEELTNEYENIEDITKRTRYRVRQEP